MFIMLPEMILTLGLGYLAGSIPFGLVLTRMAGMGDIRAIGSGNIGATNVLRTGNKFLAFLTLLFDTGKGAAIVLAVSYFGWGDPLMAGLGAILGHCFPAWLGLKGGKGVATTLGTLLAALPVTGLAAIAVWLVTAALFRISSLAALVAMASAPVSAYFLYSEDQATIAGIIAALVIYRHKDNIERLKKGSEPKIGAKK